MQHSCCFLQEMYGKKLHARLIVSASRMFLKRTHKSGPQGTTLKRAPCVSVRAACWFDHLLNIPFKDDAVSPSQTVVMYLISLRCNTLFEWVIAALLVFSTGKHGSIVHLSTGYQRYIK